MPETQAPMQEIQQILKNLAHPAANNDPILWIHQQAMMQARNNGFPCHLYHATLDPVMAINSAQEQALAEKGYSRTFKPHNHPKWLFRRNMEEKFEAEGFIESRLVQTSQQESGLKKGPIPKTCGPWMDSPTLIEALPEASEEDPAVTVARLEGQLAELRAVKQNRRE